MGRNGNVRTVNRNRRSLELALTGAAFGALALGSPAVAADMPLKAPHLRPAFDWSGFYIGGHTGYGRGSSTAVLSDPLSVSTNSVFSGVIGGVQGGYNVQLPSGLVLGVEAVNVFRCGPVPPRQQRRLARHVFHDQGLAGGCHAAKFPHAERNALELVVEPRPIRLGIPLGSSCAGDQVKAGGFIRTLRPHAAG